MFGLLWSGSKPVHMQARPSSNPEMGSAAAAGTAEIGALALTHRIQCPSLQFWEATHLFQPYHKRNGENQKPPYKMKMAKTTPKTGKLDPYHMLLETNNFKPCEP